MIIEASVDAEHKRSAENLEIGSYYLDRSMEPANLRTDIAFTKASPELYSLKVVA